MISGQFITVEAKLCKSAMVKVLVDCNKLIVSETVKF